MPTAPDTGPNRAGAAVRCRDVRPKDAWLAPKKRSRYSLMVIGELRITLGNALCVFDRL